jgi:hypothetical protein
VEQQIRGGEIVMVNGPVKRRGAITLSIIDINTGLDESSNGGRILRLDRFNETKILARGEGE